MGVPNENRQELLKKTFYIRGVLERAGLKVFHESANSGTQYLKILGKGATIRISDHVTHRKCSFDINPNGQSIEEVLMEIFLRYKLSPPLWMGKISWGKLNKLKWDQVREAVKRNESSEVVSLLGDNPVRKAESKVPEVPEKIPCISLLEDRVIRKPAPVEATFQGMTFEVETTMDQLL